jgi:hypothetical protein
LLVELLDPVLIIAGIHLGEAPEIGKPWFGGRVSVFTAWIKVEQAIPARNGPGYFRRGDDAHEMVYHATSVRGRTRAAESHETLGAACTSSSPCRSRSDSSMGDGILFKTEKGRVKWRAQSKPDREPLGATRSLSLGECRCV